MSLFRNLFKEGARRDVITLFHSPSNAASMRAHALLKQTAAAASSTATEDQASDHSKQSKVEREFDLDIQEALPTSDQLHNILAFLGPSSLGSAVKDATSLEDAEKKFRASESSFVRPITVDWENGKAGEFTARLVRGRERASACFTETSF
nr:hypothetical protein B0A51_14352 [Rachicladosporium sp. CCFEE 5018]